ncbi:ACP S-malonyltransferase [bacterium]|nr:ACP S-malonyltransferase [bacterium]
MTEKFAYVFPGQGAQYQGMGKDFFENYEEAKKVFQTADKILNKNISEICFNGNEQELKMTVNTQPCIVAVEIAILEVLKKELNIEPFAVAGHSLGEYSAMYAAGVLNLEDTFLAIQKRANSMSSVHDGKMAAVISDDIELINKCLNDAKSLGIISIANYNSPKQVVITGENRAVDEAMELLSANGIKKIIPLAVSGAFHSELMKISAEDFSSILDKIKINNSKIPVYTNVDGKPEILAENFREKMPKQIYSSVYWTQTIQNMVNDGVTTFVEIGPGRVLSGLIRKTVPDARVFNLSDMSTLKSTIEEIKVKEII